MKFFSVSEISAMLASGELSSVELTKKYLDEAQKHNADTRAYISVYSESALRAASLSDQKRKNGDKLGLLEGIPFAVKDNICVEGMRTTCGSKMLEDFISPYTATAVNRLFSEGAIVLGKTNMDEYGMGSATDTSAFGVTKNPLNTAYTAGGSSGGSAAALAAGTCAFALGTDTGGSTRQPSAFCGLVGMKPTYGSVSRYGLVAFASSLEQICPMTHTVKDNALLLQVLCGQDEYDATTVKREKDFVPKDDHMRGLTVGVPTAELERVSSDVRHAVLRAANALKDAGADIIEISLPDVDTALAAYYVISSSEASSNLARYDGVRYGHSAKATENTDELFVRSRSEGFGDEVKRRILLGTFCLSVQGKDSYYKKALRVKKDIIHDFNTTFEKADVILMPVMPSNAYKFENKSSRSLDVWREDIFCVLANLSGLPAVSVPFGKGDNGLPMGVQLMGKAFSEQKLYRSALCLEKARSVND